MLVTSHLARPILMAALFTAPVFAGPQVANVRVLLEIGTVLPSGEQIAQFYSSDVANDGTWTVIARVHASPNPSRIVVFVDGVERISTGDVLSDGSEVRGLLSVRAVPGGAYAALVSAEHPASPGVFARQIVTGAGSILAEGQQIHSSTLGLDATVLSIQGFDIESPHVAVSCTVRTSAGLIDRWLLQGTVGSGSLTPTGVTRTGDTLIGTATPFFSATGTLAVTEAGVRIAAVRVLDGGLPLAVVRDDEVIAENGGPGPLAASTWSFPEPPLARTNDAGDVLVRGTVHLPDGTDSGLITLNGQIVAQDGDVIVGAASAYGFQPAESPVMLTDGGEVILLPSGAFNGYVLLANNEILLEANVSTVAGASIRWFSVDASETSASPDGGLIIVAARLDPDVDAFLLVEREATVPTNCDATPNSTGAVGQLSILGSRDLDVGGLFVNAHSLPTHTMGYLLTSPAEGFVPLAGGASGNLCLGAAIGRFTDQVFSSDFAGAIATSVDGLALPGPSGPRAAAAGETWFFQLWHRDVVGGAATSNFTQSLGLMFL